MTITKKQSIIIAIVSAILIGTFTIIGVIIDHKNTPEELTTEVDSVIFEEVASEIIEEESSEPVVTTEQPTTEISTSKADVITEPVTNVNVEGYFDVPLSTDLQDHIFSICKEYGVDPALVIAIIEQESTYDPGAVNYNGTCFGLMQVYEYYHTDRMARLGVTDLFDPYQNVKVGIDILAGLYATGNSTEWVLTKYSGGSSYYYGSVMNKFNRLRGSL